MNDDQINPDKDTAPDITGFSASPSDSRCLQVWFKHNVTDADRAWLLAAINAARDPAQTAQEPIGWLDHAGFIFRRDLSEVELEYRDRYRPLYASPQKASPTRDEVMKALCCPNGCVRDGDCWAKLPRYCYGEEADAVLKLFRLQEVTAKTGGDV